MNSSNSVKNESISSEDTNSSIQSSMSVPMNTVAVIDNSQADGIVDTQAPRYLSSSDGDRLETATTSLLSDLTRTRPISLKLTTRLTHLSTVSLKPLQRSMTELAPSVINQLRLSSSSVAKPSLPSLRVSSVPYTNDTINYVSQINSPDVVTASKVLADVGDVGISSSRNIGIIHTASTNLPANSESTEENTPALVPSKSTPIPAANMSMHQNEPSSAPIPSSIDISTQENISVVDPTTSKAISTVQPQKSTSQSRAAFNSSITIKVQPITSVNASSVPFVFNSSIAVVNASMLSPSFTSIKLKTTTFPISPTTSLLSIDNITSSNSILNITMPPKTATSASLLVNNMTSSSLTRNMTMLPKAPPPSLSIDDITSSSLITNVPISPTASFLIQNMTSSSLTRNMTTLPTLSTPLLPTGNYTSSSFTGTTTSSTPFLTFDNMTARVNSVQTSTFYTLTTVIPTELLDGNATSKTLYVHVSTVLNNQSASSITRPFPRFSSAPPNHNMSTGIVNTIHPTGSSEDILMTMTMTPKQPTTSTSTKPYNKTSLFSPTPSSAPPTLITPIPTSPVATTTKLPPILLTDSARVEDTSISMNIQLPTPFMEWKKITVLVIIDGKGE